MKTCRECLIEYADVKCNFYSSKRDGFQTICKACKKVADRCYYEKNKNDIKARSSEHYANNKETRREYYEENKDAIKVRHDEWVDLNKERIREYGRLYHADNRCARKKHSKDYHIKNSETLNAKSRKYYQENKSEIATQRRLRRNADPIVRIRQNLSRRLSQVMRDAGLNKDVKTMDMLGCDMRFFKNYIEDLFIDGMSWDNYGFKGWHIDHIKPCVAFNFSDEVEKKKCFHYTNLQPLWCCDNWSKQAFYEGCSPRRCSE